MATVGQRIAQLKNEASQRALVIAGLLSRIEVLEAAVSQVTFNVTPYDFTGKDSYFAASPQTTMTETAFDTSRHPSTGFIFVDVEASILNSATGHTGNLFKRWGNSATDSYILTVINGHLAFFYRDIGGTPRFPETDVPLASVLPDRTRGFIAAALNTSGAAVTIDGMTFPVATCTFLYSSNRTAWTVIGSVKSVPNDALRTGAAPAVIGGEEMTGRIYRARVRDSSGKVLYNADMRGLENGSYANFSDTGTGAGVTAATWTTNGVYMQTMDPRTSAYPRLAVANSWKMKGLQLLPDLGSGVTDGNNGTLWAKWPDARFAERIAYGKSQGFNTIKFACGGARDAATKYPQQATLEGYIAQTCALLRTNGLRYYLGLAGPDQIINSDGTGLSTLGKAIADTLALWMKYGADLIVGMDLVNENQFGRPSTWGASGTDATLNQRAMSDILKFYKMVRTVAPDVPCSFSIYCSGKDRLRTYEQFDTQAALCMQYHGYHPYNGNNNLDAASNANASEFPQSNDVAYLETRVTFLGFHLIDEIGFQNRNTDENKTTVVSGIIAQANRPKSGGFIAFGDYNYSSSERGDYGIRQNAKMTELFLNAPNYTIA